MPELAAPIVCLSRTMPLLPQRPGRNDCGPHAAAMAVSFYRMVPADPEVIARAIRFLRVPMLGATLPWGISLAVRQNGLRGGGRWLTPVEALLASIRADHPVVVIVRPTDLPSCPRYALHYRVAVGYRHHPDFPGGGELYFNCSASPPRAASTTLPGNVSVDFATFRRQWRTYLTFDWSLAVTP